MEEKTAASAPAGIPADEGQGVRLEREALYAEVWAMPLSKLAPKYNLSDSGLRNACLALSIPLPGRGHWTRVAAGHAVSQAPLPKTADRTVFYSYGKSLASALDEDRAGDDAWLARMLSQEERLRAETIPPSKTIPQPVQALKAACERANARAQEQLQRLRSPTPRDIWRPGRPDIAALTWAAFARDFYSMATHDPMALRVSATGIERACAALAMLCDEAARRGFEISPAPAVRSAQLAFDGWTLLATVREVFTGAVLRRDAGATRQFPTKAGTGRFTLIIEGAGRTPLKVAEQQVGDLLLAIRSGAVLEAIFRRIVHARRQRRVDAARDKARAEESAHAALVRERRAHQTAASEAEAANRKALLGEATRWDQVQMLRAYIAHLRAAAGDEPSPQLQAWLLWAEDVAADMDPTTVRVG